MRRPRQKSLAELEKQCAVWNRACPVGTEVHFHPVIGAPLCRLRKTASLAQVLSGHTAVIWLEGERGCVALDAVEFAS
jgi:hypothetical protein